MLNHGGQLNNAAETYQIPVEDWPDLSTGINPNSWPVPHDLPKHIWSQLPQDNDGLLTAAHAYYQTNALLAVAGSQAAIQALPALRSRSNVAIVSPSYAEHAHAWQQAGHELLRIKTDELNDVIENIDVLILINPNNPSGDRYSKQQLLTWHQMLARKGGWLIVDEAFIDAQPENSLIEQSPRSGLIVLRSLGKFFGLAGLRVGFVHAEHTLLDKLAEQLGPWTISHAARYLATLALADHKWHANTRLTLKQHGDRLHKLLSQCGLTPSGGCALFQWIKTEQALSIHTRLAQQGILTRYFDKPNSLRFGLPDSEKAWHRLETTLTHLMSKKDT